MSEPKSFVASVPSQWSWWPVPVASGMLGDDGKWHCTLTPNHDYRFYGWDQMEFTALSSEGAKSMARAMLGYDPFEPGENVVWHE